MNTVNSKKYVVNKYTKNEVGYSLLELLISLTIGAFILGGIATTFISNKTTDSTRNAISEMDANARIAMQALRQTIAHAGYPSTRNIVLDKPFYSKTDGVTTNKTCRGGVKMSPYPTNAYIPRYGQFTRDRSLNRGDVITAVYMGDNPCLTGNSECENDDANSNTDALVYSDCTAGGVRRKERSVACSTDADEGMLNPRDAKIYSTFYLGNPGNDSQKGVLYCRGNRGGTQPIAENIYSMQFLYGVTFEDGTSRFLRANEVEKGFDKAWSGDDDYWGMVNRVKVGLLMYSSHEDVSKVDSQENYLLLGEKIIVSDRRRLYRVYNTTINLPNMNRGLL